MDPLPSTHFDSSLQTLALDDPLKWSQLRIWLGLLRTFLTFTNEWSRAASATDGAREHLRDLPSLVKSEFENAERDIQDAVKKGDTAKLDELQSKLVEKMDHYKPKVRDAYNFLSWYVFQNNNLSEVILVSQQWFPSYASLLDNFQILHSSNFLSSNPLYGELESVLEFLESLHLRQIMFRDGELFRDLCIQHGGLAICLAGLLFSWWAVEGEDTTSSAKAKLSDLVLKIKPATPTIMVQYLEAIKSQIHSLQEDLMVELVGITLLAPNGSPPPEADCLVFLIRHLVDSDMDDADIGRIVSDAASNPDLLGRLLQEAELLRIKILLTELGDHESIHQGPLFDDAHSKNMMQIPEEIQTTLDFYLVVFQAFLMELMSRNSVLILDVKGQVQQLIKESKRFRRYSSILPLKNPVDMEMILTLMVVATGEAKKLHDLVVEENKSDLSRLLSEFLEQLTVINNKVEEVYLQFRESSMVCFPKTFPGLSFVESFLERLGVMRDKTFPEGYCIDSQIEAVLEGENSLAEVLKKVGEKDNDNQDLTDLKRRVARAAYEADYIIDSMRLIDADTCHLLWLSDAVNEMNLVKKDLMKFCGRKNHLVRSKNLKTMESKESAQSDETSEAEEFIVPVDDQVSQVSKLLTNGKSDKFMVGIVGTPGIGKTTLARTVYDQFKSHFQKHAWCTISQEFRKREVLLKILQDINLELVDNLQVQGRIDEKALLQKLKPELVDNLQDRVDEKALLQKLKEDLQGKRYLIVMDDMWSEEAWIGLEKGIPEPQNGSRILFTSRIETVLSSYKNSVSVYSPRHLSDEESWNLLQRRVFGENLKCPDGLRNVGGILQAVVMGCLLQFLWFRVF